MNPGPGHPAYTTHLLGLLQFSITAGGIPCTDLDRDVPGMGEGEQGYVKVRSGRQRRRARQDLNLLLTDAQVGEGAPAFPRGHSQNSPAIRVPVPQPSPESGATLPPSTLPYCPSPAKAGGPERRPASPASPPALLPPQAGQHGGRPCLLPREPAARPDGADEGREAAKLSVWRCPSEPLLAGARRVGRR